MTLLVAISEEEICGPLISGLSAARRARLSRDLDDTAATDAAEAAADTANAAVSAADGTASSYFGKGKGPMTPMAAPSPAVQVEDGRQSGPSSYFRSNADEALLVGPVKNVDEDDLLLDAVEEDKSALFL